MELGLYIMKESAFGIQAGELLKCVGDSGLYFDGISDFVNSTGQRFGLMSYRVYFIGAI